MTTIQTINPTVANELILAKQPLTHITAGTGAGKTYSFTNTDTNLNVLFVTTNNTIKVQTEMVDGQAYNVQSLIKAFENEEPLRGVVSAEALLMAYESFTFGSEDTLAVNLYLTTKLDALVLDEFHLYLTEASYRPALGEVFELFKVIGTSIITLTATPIATLIDNGAKINVIGKSNNISSATIVVLPKDAGTHEVTKEMTAKAYTKAGLTDGKLLESGKYEVTTTKNIKAPTGFAKAQKLNALSLITEDYLNTDKTGLIILSEESKAVSREMVAQLNEAHSGLDMIMLDRDLFNLAMEAKAEADRAVFNKEGAMEAVYAEYPFMTLYTSNQLLNRPIMLTSFGKQGMNILDDVDNAIVVMMAGSVNRNISNESKLQVVGRFRNSKSNTVYDLVNERSITPEAKRNTPAMINAIGIDAVIKSSPLKDGVMTIIKARTPIAFKKACFNYTDGLGDITIGSITALWSKYTDTVSTIKLDAKVEGFETQSTNIVSEVLKVSNKVAQYPQLTELFTEVTKTVISNKASTDTKEVSDAKIDVVLAYFPMVARLVALEVFDALASVWSEHISHTEITNELLNPTAKWSEIVQYKVRNNTVTDQGAIEAVIAQLTPMNISKLPKRQLALIASVLPKEYANVVTGTAKFTEKKEIINIWISGKNDKSTRIRHYDFNEYVTLEAINERMLIGTLEVANPKVVEMNTKFEVEAKPKAGELPWDVSETVTTVASISDKTMIKALVGALSNPRLSNTVRATMEAKLANSNETVRNEVLSQLI